jgi:hypothetical protein
LEWLKDDDKYNKTCDKIGKENLYYSYEKALKDLNIGQEYNMRSIRCNYATKWVKEKTECEI